MSNYRYVPFGLARTVGAPADLDLPPWLKRRGAELSLAVHVQPNTGKTEISGVHDGALKLRVRAPAVADRANAAVCHLLAKLAGIPEGSVTLLRGHKSRHKIIRIDQSSTEIVAKLKQLGAIRNDSQT